MMLSKNFSLAEMTRSTTAQKKRIENVKTPSDWVAAQVSN